VPFRTARDAIRHFERHKQEFPGCTQESYEKLAEEFVCGSLRPGIRECKRKDGSIVRFDPATQEFGARASETGPILTYMIPRPGHFDRRTPEQYFEDNCKG